MFPSTCLRPTRLEKSREDDGPLLLVLVAELLAVGLLLAPGPRPHEVAADGDKEGQGGAAGDGDDAGPSDDLEHVVGAGDEAEAVAAGDLAGGLAGLPQRGEVVVDVSVGELAEDVQGEAGVGEEVPVGEAGGGREGRVDLECAQEAGRGPVEEGVSDDEHRRHRVGGELVHEHRLQLPLDEVRHDHPERQLLGARQIGARDWFRQHALEELV